MKLYGECTKKAFGSRRAARDSVCRRRRFGSKTFRQYFCHECRAWHNTTDKQINNVDRGEWDDQGY